MNEVRITRRSRREPPTSETDWDRLAAQTDEDIAKRAESDLDAAPLMTAEWLARATIVIPNKRPISIRLDADILEFFQKEGKNYQTRINNVLRAYVDLNRKRA